MQKLKDYVKFLYKQMFGWTTQSYVLMFIAIGFQIGLFTSGVSVWNFISMLGSIISVACVLAISNARSINGLFGIVSAILISAVSFHATNYMEIFMQLAYIIFLDIPVLVNPYWNKNMENNIKRFKDKFGNLEGKSAVLAHTGLALLLNALVFLGSWFLIGHFTNDARPMIDALTFSIGFTGSILCWQRFSEQYYWWITGGLFSVILWGMTAFSGDTNLSLFCNYLIFLCNDLIGLFGNTPWFKKKETQAAVVDIDKITK